MQRIYHPWHKWECFRAGFFNSSADIPDYEARVAYMNFLADLPRFQSGISRVFCEWPHSCDQFLSNENINRIAWIGQSAMCIETGVPAIFRGGFKLLSVRGRAAANNLAEQNLMAWLKQKGNDARKNTPIPHRLETMRLF